MTVQEFINQIYDRYPDRQARGEVLDLTDRLLLGFGIDLGTAIRDEIDAEAREDHLPTPDPEDRRSALVRSVDSIFDDLGSRR